ncbi:MAG TPA: RelA/SpoT family protein [Candidatus Acidoferrales bacterium]|nr:RelA/SpoT family protein [Candidatus Acidoferrales bacterium]
MSLDVSERLDRDGSVELRDITGFSDLILELRRYLDGNQIADVIRACEFGMHAHAGQVRLNGEPYISHPVAVARILAGMRLDHRSIMAALLHDVIEDTPTAKEHIAHLFDAEVAGLVDGVSKLTQIQFKSKAEAQAESFLKMMLAMSQDIRVMLIKLADRLHNMRTLDVMRPDKRRRIARETLTLYAPIANRLGMNALRIELEDLSFAALHPFRYRVLAEVVERARSNRKRVLDQVETALKSALAREHVGAQVTGRDKHLYSLYLRLRNRETTFSELTDLYACRIQVERVDDCYRALGIAHAVYKPVPGRFRDYIAIPKANGYQSLHTVLFGPHGVPIELQIRTREMDLLAEVGVVAHWQYPFTEHAAPGGTQDRAREWMHSIMEMQQRVGSSVEFLESVKGDLFPDEIYVFTPKGRIMRLPVGATPVDFAYAVHTDIGNRCAAAKVDRRIVPLSTPLRNGQTVEILTSESVQPNPAWLNFITTARARTSIRHYLKHLKADEAAALGRRLLERALSTYRLMLDEIQDTVWQQVLAHMGVSTREALFEALGLGEYMAPLVARRLAQEAGAGVDADALPADQAHEALTIRGTEGMVVTLGRCCHPIPGDRILGFLSSGRGIVIHTQTCRNLNEYRKHPDKWIDVQWESHPEREFPVEIRMEAANQRGVLAQITAEMARMDTNIEHVTVDEKYGHTSSLVFTITVRDRLHLARILRHLHAMPCVIRVSRSKA